MKTILLTGAAGFIGSNFLRYLYYKYPHYSFIVLDALTYSGSEDNLPNRGQDPRIEFWHGNVQNPDIVDNLVAKADVVVHFAAESHVTRSIYDNLDFFKTDVIGTQVVTNTVLKHRDHIDRFIHISTSEVYGTAAGATMNETHPLNPMSPYAAAKCGADRLVYSYQQTYDIPAVVVRPFNNYGPYQHLEKLIPRLITSSLLQEPLTVHGEGKAARDYLFVQDHCAALDKILHIDRDKVIGEVINLGSGNSITVLELAQLIGNMIVGDNYELRFIGDRPGQVLRHTCDSSKALKLLNWQPQIPLREGLERTIEWYRENTNWWQRQLNFRQIPVISNDGKQEMH